MSTELKLGIWVASLCLIGALLFGVYRYGRHVEGLERDTQQLHAVQKAVEDANRSAAIDKDKAMKEAADEAARKIAQAGRTAKVERSISAHPEYASCAISADDLAELNAAVEGK